MTNAVDVVADRVRAELAEIELDVMTEGVTLPDLIRQGARHSDKAVGWTDSDGGVCALSAAEAALRARRA